MASRLFQSIILQMKDAIDRTVGIIDASGTVVACSDLKRIGEMREDAAAELSYVGGNNRQRLQNSMDKSEIHRRVSAVL